MQHVDLTSFASNADASRMATAAAADTNFIISHSLHNKSFESCKADFASFLAVQNRALRCTGSGQSWNICLKFWAQKEDLTLGGLGSGGGAMLRPHPCSRNSIFLGDLNLRFKGRPN